MRAMSRNLALAAIPCWLLLAAAPSAAAQAAAQANAPNDYVNYGSRELGGVLAPRLAVEYNDGTRANLTATADAILIGYLPGGAYGGLSFLAVNLCGSNRSLVQFPSVTKPIHKAEIVLRLIPPGHNGASPAPPPLPFEIGAYAVRAAWDERQVSWDSRPEEAEEAAATVRTRPDAAEVRLDVTGSAPLLADPDAAARGWMIRAARLLPWNGPEPGSGGMLEDALLNLIPWTDDVPRAIGRACAEHKLVLVCVRANVERWKTTFLEQMLMASALADPDVLALIEARFVPIRVCGHPAEYTMEGAAVDRRDPLAPLGTSLRDERPTALVVSDGKRRIAGIRNLGTFDRDLILRFLQDALDRAGDDAGGPPTGADARGLLAAGYLKQARERYERMAGRDRMFGLARIAALQGDHHTALRHALPLAGTEGPLRTEAATEAGRALVRLGRFREAIPLLERAAATDATAVYDLGCAWLKSGEPGKAHTTWQAVARQFPGTTAAARAQARLNWPEAMAMYENLTALGPDAAAAIGRGTTEVDRSHDEDRAVRTAVDYLLATQDRDGTWSSATQAGTYRAAITALVARSLHAWSTRLDADGLGDGNRAARARHAAERATIWLNHEIGRAEPAWMDSFGAAYSLDYFLDLEERNATVRGDIPAAIRLLLAGQCPGGAWSYNVQFGVRWARDRDPQTAPARTHSVNTGLALLALARAKQRGHEVDARTLDGGKKTLLAMRERAGVYTYIYPGPRNFHTPDSSAARGALCEHALALLGAVPDRDIDAAIDLFLEYRADLRKPVKIWGPTWLPPRAHTSYFYFFAYDHAARAMAYRGDRAAERLARLRDDLLRMVEVDGTWFDYESIGKPYGTAMALHVLFLAREARAHEHASR